MKVRLSAVKLVPKPRTFDRGSKKKILTCAGTFFWITFIMKFLESWYKCGISGTARYHQPSAKLLTDFFFFKSFHENCTYGKDIEQEYLDSYAWKAWMLYFCLPMCSAFIPTNLLEHFVLFVNSTYTLLKVEITKDELNKCERDLMAFVAHYETHYGTSNMSFNVHVVVHLVMSFRMSGPMWATSALPFESNIYALKQTINGPKSMEHQMFEIFESVEISSSDT